MFQRLLELCIASLLLHLDHVVELLQVLFLRAVKGGKEEQSEVKPL